MRKLTKSWAVIGVIAALIITVMIGRAAFEILRDNGMLLTDTAIAPARDIERIALQIPEVLSVHKIRSRRGPRGGYADLHVQLHGDLPLETAHDIGHRVADRVREELGVPDVLVHVEPPHALDQSGVHASSR